MALKINEIFHSIQGESTWAGLPFIFIRLTGCNLRCSYCDTRHAYDEGSDREIDELVRHIARFNCRRVAITGGEPLLQAETPALVAQLLEHGYTVTMETNGSMDIRVLDARCVKVVDVKCPSSGMVRHNLPGNLVHIGEHDQLKFVIADRDDFEFASEKIDTVKNRLPSGRILLSPAFGDLAPDRLARWMLDAQLDARMQLQLHKYIWPHESRGR